MKANVENRQELLDTIENWLKENQSKPIVVYVVAFEFAQEIYMNEGFSFRKEFEDTFIVKDSASDTYFQLMPYDNNFTFTTNSEEMETPDFDFEFSTEHVTVSISVEE